MPTLEDKAANDQSESLLHSRSANIRPSLSNIINEDYFGGQPAVICDEEKVSENESDIVNEDSPDKLKSKSQMFILQNLKLSIKRKNMKIKRKQSTEENV